MVFAFTDFPFTVPDGYVRDTEVRARDTFKSTAHTSHHDDQTFYKCDALVRRRIHIRPRPRTLIALNSSRGAAARASTCCARYYATIGRSHCVVLVDGLQ